MGDAGQLRDRREKHFPVDFFDATNSHISSFATLGGRWGLIRKSRLRPGEMAALLRLNRAETPKIVPGRAVTTHEEAFANRREAGRLLAERLTSYRDLPDLLVLGMARGGVPVAFEIAQALGARLDIFILRKLGVPGHEELAFGAIATGGAQVLDEPTINALGLSPAQIHDVLTQARQEMERRERRYRKDRSPLDAAGKTAMLVDDGVATGSSVRAGISALRKMRAARIVVAVPVAPLITLRLLQSEADEAVCLSAPEAFRAVGGFYADFSQVSDEEVENLLHQAAAATRT